MEKFAPFFAEARKRIIVTVVIFVSSTFAGFIFYEDIIRFLIDILGLKGINIVFTSPFQFINLAISCGAATGIVVALPILIIQTLTFLKPALKYKEFRMVMKFLPFSFVLFILGFFAGAYLMKWQIEIFLAKSISLGIGNILDISSLLSTVLLTSALMGLAFQFPIILLLLLRLDLITRQSLSKKRKWVYLGSFLFALLLPPDSILADILLSLPLIVLYELTLIANFIYERGKAKSV